MNKDRTERKDVRRRQWKVRKGTRAALKYEDQRRRKIRNSNVMEVFNNSLYSKHACAVSNVPVYFVAVLAAEKNAAAYA